LGDLGVNLVTEHDETLKSDDENHDHNEHGIGMNLFHEVPFIIDLSCAQHVEDLHPHEHVEDD
jgi:hypothetical protein